MMRTWYTLLLSAVLLLTLAACGGSGGSNSGGGPSSSAASSAAGTEAELEVVIKADNWKFDAAEYALPANTPVLLTLENIKGAHGVQIVGTDIKIRQGSSEVVNLAPGTYDIECNIMCGSGHSQMKAKLVVS